jgi:hypothetical protein
MMLSRAALAFVLALAASPALAAPAALPTGSFTVAGHAVTVSLPYRKAEGWSWVGATRMSQLAPLTFKGLAVKEKAGPGGTDLAVFSYEASGPGTPTLTFGLVPNGQMLIGPPTMTYKAPPAKTFQAKIVVK